MKLMTIGADIATILAALLGLPAFLKKKPFCLWYWELPKWQLKSGPFSARR